MSALDELCANAVQRQLEGQLDEAERLYRDVLLIDGRHAAANHCFGMLNVQLHRPLEAMPYLLAALEASPQLPDYWLGYLEALLLAGRLEDARTTLALAKQHGLAGAAVTEFATRLQAAPPQDASQQNASAQIASSQQNVSHQNASPQAAPERGAAASGAMRPSRAASRRRERLARDEEKSLAAMLQKGQFADGLAFARGLTERFPERALGWKTLGALLFASGCAQDAVAAMQEAIRTAPQDAETHKNLGTVFNKLDRLDEAERSLRSALQIAPQYAAAHSHLASTYQLQGRFAEAEACYRRAISLPAQDLPDDSYTGLLFMLSHNPDIGADALFAEHLKIGERIAAAAPASRPRHANIPDPERRLQVGFVSGDLCRHPLANFFEPMLAQLRDRPGLELHVYHVNAAEDEVSARLRGYVRHWHAVRSLSPAQLADRIESDGIDVLIDLSGHTSLNRLRTFARKPAPIQASWMGYPGTTGLRAMDYYLSDRHFLPPGRFARYFTEKLVYLPALAPFQPYAAAPPVNPLPALGTGHITFGSFNRLGKITAATLRLWARLLIALPDSRMLLAGLPVKEQDTLIAMFAAHGITVERLTFHPRCGMEQYLALHHRVDLCLDTHPYNGGTTTMHAVWMGVPTLTLAGSTPPSRAGAAILGQLDLQGFTAETEVQFVALGRYWATHLGELADVRGGLRSRLQRAPGSQAGAIADAFECAIRHMWRRWCAHLPNQSFHSPGLEAVTHV